jgi:hypothetical protein
MVLSDFRLYEITDANLRAELTKKLDVDREFVQTKPNVWMAEFKVDETKYEAAIRLGHGHDVAADTEQPDIQLRAREADFDNDAFFSASKIQAITKLVSEKFVNRHHAS